MSDAKNLLRANIDIFAHMISDMDEELLALFKQHPNTYVLTALGGPRRIVYSPWLNPPHPLILETVLPQQVKRLQDRLASQSPTAVEEGKQAWDRLARGLKLLANAGVKIGIGTDGGGQTGDQFVGWTMHTELENVVSAGLTPMQALTAATRTSAEVLGLTDLGSVATGKSADFIVLDGNPLDDITNTRRISKVFLRGHEVDRAKLRAGWTRAVSSN
jgi:imidazolonepropionase-like amidohydrolase